MSGVLHPVGPEPASTYWLRRALVVGVVAALIALFALLIPNGETTQLAVPAAGTASPTSSAAVTPAPASPSTSSTPTSTRSAKAESTAKASSKSTATSKSTASAKPKAKATEAPPAGPALCDPGDLRATLTGTPRVRVKKVAVFNLSLINGSKKTCRISVNAENFELKITTGKDTIWTTGDCSTSVRSINADVASQKAAVWRMKWNGRGSAPGCKSESEVPKAGSYVATAQLSEAKAAKMRLFVTG